MGDRSPKALNKTSKQHDLKTKGLAEKKQAAVNAKKSVGKK